MMLVFFSVVFVAINYVYIALMIPEIWAEGLKVLAVLSGAVILTGDILFIKELEIIDEISWLIWELKQRRKK